MSRLASQDWYRAKAKHSAGRDRSKIPKPFDKLRAGSAEAPSSCWAAGGSGRRFHGGKDGEDKTNGGGAEGDDHPQEYNGQTKSSNVGGGGSDCEAEGSA
jgi:hypothetical protein